VSFQFPNAPTSGQTYEPVGGPVFVWDGTAWKSQTQGVPVTVHVGDSPPASPALGQLWWESDSGNLFIWYADGDSAQWVQVSGMPKTEPPTALARNRIVNGAMQISQENGDTASSGAAGNPAYYPADQWSGRWGISPGSMNCARWAGPIGVNGSAVIYMNVLTAKASLAAGDYVVFTTNIEGKRVADFQWGTAWAKAVVLRFTMQAPVSGTYSARVANAAANRSFVAQFPLVAGVPSTVIIPIPGDTTGTWLKDTGLGLSIDFVLGVGSTYTGTTGWQAGNVYAGPGQANGVSATGQFHIYDVGLYLDPDNTGLPPKWQMPDEAEELRACQRYFWRWDSSESAFTVLGIGQYLTATAFLTPVTNPVKMRGAPAVSFSAAATFAPITTTAISTDVMTSTNLRINCVVSGGTAKQAELLTARSVTTAFMNVSARM
jgi:hypothetical protein